MRFFHITLCTILIIIGEPAVHAKLRFNHITTKEGLSQSTINCIHQDFRGFIWIGTFDGLNRYDGHQFKIYRENPLNPNSISYDAISCIYENPADSTLWIGTRNGGLNSYNRKRDNFTVYRHNKQNPLSIANNRISALLTDQNKQLWIGTYGNGLCAFNSTDSTFFRPEFTNQYEFRSIYSLAIDNSGDIWIGTHTGLFRWKKKDQKENKEPERITLPQLPNGTTIAALEFDFKGNLWIGTSNKGLIKYHPISRNYIHFLKSSKNNLSPFIIRDILQTHNGKIWVATDKGLFEYIPKTNRLEMNVNNPDDKESLNSDEIMALGEDQSGTLWIGTFSRGLNKLNPGYTRFKTYKNLVSYQERHNDYNDIRGICRDNDNNLWICTQKGLLQTNVGMIKSGRAGRTAQVFLKGEKVIQVFHNKKHGLFVSTTNNIYHRKGKNNFQNISNKIKTQTGMNVKFFWKAISGSDGFIWFASSMGLLKYNTHKDTFELLTPKTDDGKSKYLYFVGLKEDYTGKIWLGSINGHLYKFDKHTNSFEHISQSSKDSIPIRFDRIFYIQETKPGIIWIGTSKGLFKFNDNDGNLTHFTMYDGLANNTIYSVLEDHDNRIWCSTNNGISVYNPKKNTFNNFTYEDGLQSNEFNQGSEFQDLNGTIYMGGVDGLNIFDPKNIVPSTYLPPLLITGMEIQYKPVTLKSHPELIDRQISETRKLVLNHNQNTFSFEYTALSFNLPNRNEYQYCLTPKGKEDQWIESGNRRYAAYTNLEPGKYTFKVKASNSDGVWNDTPTEMQLTIVPPFWQTWWFKILIIAFLGTTVYLFFHLRIRTIKKQKIKLERLILEKTKELTQQKELIDSQNKELTKVNQKLKATNEKVSQNNIQLQDQHEKILSQRDHLLQMAQQVEEANQVKLRFFTNISHELRTPLTLIISPIKELLNSIEEVNTRELVRKLSVVYGNASKLLLIVNQLLDFRKAETETMEMKISNFELVSFVKQTAYLFNGLAQQKNYHFSVKSKQDQIKIWADQEKVEKIIYNLLSNAFKHTPEKGEIEISLLASEDRDHRNKVIMTIKDNGLGMDESKIPLIFERYYQLDQPTKSSQGGSGLGLALVKKYVDLHHGKITVKSSPGKGSTFSIEIPLGKDHFDKNVQFESQKVSNAELLASSIVEYTPTSYQVIATSEDKDKPKLLLVEDDKDLRLYLKDTLSEQYIVWDTDNVTKGKELATTRHPNLIISDVMLPDSTGFKLCEQVKEDFSTSHIPVILLTALADHQNHLTGIRSGADAYISKPFDLHQLFLTIDNLLENRRKIQQKFIHGVQMDEKELTDNQEEQQFLKRAIGMVEKHLDDPKFDVNLLCDKLMLSQSQVYRKIKALTDLSTSEFIRTIRLKKAAQLLQTHKYKVNQVAYEVGFNDPSYFTKCFTLLFGQKPSDYVKNI